MLTDEQIEKIIYKYTSRQDEFNMAVIEIIADRLSRIAEFDKLGVLEREVTIRKDVVRINLLYKDYVEKQTRGLEDDLWWIGLALYAEALPFYENQVALRKNNELMELTSKLTKEVQQNLLDVIKRPVFVIRDLKSPKNLKAHNLENAYRSILNEALVYSNASKSLQEVALKRTETQLFDSGIRYAIDNSSDSAKDTTSANVVVRGSVLEGIKKFINQMQEVMGKQFGADGLELSAHIYPAPDHAPAQGHQFSFEDVKKMQAGENFEDLQGHTYVGFERNIGEWNCRHYFMRIKRGVKPQYSQAQLDKILEDNERGYTDAKGKHRTLYECTQIQRRYEREIRKAKEKYLYGKALNDKAMMSTARNRVGKLTTQYKQFSQMCDIPAKLERIKVKDYR